MLRVSYRTLIRISLTASNLKSEYVYIEWKSLCSRQNIRLNATFNKLFQFLGTNIPITQTIQILQNFPRIQ